MREHLDFQRARFAFPLIHGNWNWNRNLDASARSTKPVPNLTHPSITPDTCHANSRKETQYRYSKNNTQKYLHVQVCSSQEWAYLEAESHAGRLQKAW